MGGLITVIDSILFIVFLVIAILAPILHAQLCLPLHILPKSIIDFNHWYSHDFGDYLFQEKPHFYLGFMWLELLFHWPLSLIALYGILSRKSWLNTTCLIYGVSLFTVMVSVLTELMGSGKASDRLLTFYFPFLGFSLLSILRGLITPAFTPDKITVLGGKKGD